MALDVVSPLSARVSATLAIACTFLFTVFKVLSPLIVRSVLDMWFAEALFSFLLAHSVSIVRTAPELSSMVVELATYLCAVFSVLRSLLPFYLVNYDLPTFLSYLLSTVEPFLPAPPIQFCVIGSSAGIRCGAARHRPTVSDLATQLIRYLMPLVGSFYRSVTSALSAIEPSLPAPPIQFCVLGSSAGIRCGAARHRPTIADLTGRLVRYLIPLVGSSYSSFASALSRINPSLPPPPIQFCVLGSSAGIRCGAARHRPTVADLSHQLFRYLIPLVGSSYRSYTSALSDIFSGTGGIVTCSVLFLCCFAFVLFRSLWPVRSLKTPLDEEELRIITKVNVSLAHAGTKALAMLDWLKQRMSTVLMSVRLFYRLRKAATLDRQTIDTGSPAVALLDWQTIDAGLSLSATSTWQTIDTELSVNDISDWQTIDTGPSVAIPAGRALPQRPERPNGAGQSVQTSNIYPSTTPNPPSHANPPAQLVYNDIPAVKANTLSGRFTDGYYINPDFHAKYKLGHELGAGANGFVLEAQRRNDGKEVAVKFVPVTQVQNWPDHPEYGRIPREVQAMSWVSHKNLVALVDVIKDDSYVYIIQELCGTLWFPRDEEGRLIYPHGNRSLHAYLLQNGAMSAKDAKYVFNQLVDVVTDCHSRGIIHCDIKPENIAIDADLKLTLLDMGNSFACDEVPRPWFDDPRMYAGTPVYMPPEIHNSEPYRPDKADVWALGAVLFQMLTCRRAFSSRAMAKEGRIALCQSEIATSEGLASLWPVIEVCLKVDPKKRIPSIALSRHSLLKP